jgi:DNA repair photolyase
MFYSRPMTGAQYTEIHCKAAVNRVQGMPFAWSLNPYRGCRHGCLYCYARVTHTFFGLNAGPDFDAAIFVKTNVAQVLRSELRRASWRRESIAIGTATDPYQPVEGRYRLTRACLNVLAEQANPASITTKGTLVARDIDVLQELEKQAGCGVNISLITLDEAIWRAFEPGTPPPTKRLAVMRRLVDAGVPCGLALAPVLPRLTDSLPALEAVVQAAADHGAAWLWSGTPHFEPAVRDWFLAGLERSFPESVPAYVRVFGAAGASSGARYTPRAYAEALTERVNELKARYGLHGEARPTPRLGQAALPPVALAAGTGPKHSTAHQLPLPC